MVNWKVGLGSILLGGTLVLTGCGEAQNSQNTHEKAVSEEKAPSKDKSTEEKQKPVKKQNKANLKVVTLGAGKFTVGEDIQAGKYIVSTQEQSGNLFVYDSNGLAEVNEILGTEPNFAVNNVSVELEEGQVIQISGLNSVVFKPKQ